MADEVSEKIQQRFQAGGGAPPERWTERGRGGPRVGCRRRELEEHGARAFSGVGKKRAEESQVAELERKVGQQAMEIDFLKRALQHVEEQRLLRALNNGAPSTRRSRRK